MVIQGRYFSNYLSLSRPGQLTLSFRYILKIPTNIDKIEENNHTWRDSIGTNCLFSWADSR